MKKKSHITVTDQFCGAGGSSQGVRRLSERYKGGVNVEMALNHWKLAIETHNTNFPETRHDCTDISACDPRRYPSTDILITSPECTNHSLAKGVKVVKKQMDLFESGKDDAAAERSRATMWDVCRFAEYHNYNGIIVENVVDARKWVLFDAWLKAMYVLGYLHKCVYLNSMHAQPTPQSRDRMYIVFWKKGNKAPDLDYTPSAWCKKCEKDVLSVQTWKKPDQRFGKYKTQYVYCCPDCAGIVEPYYHAAFNCIDWSDIGQRIGDRKHQLAPNTLDRINYGLKKYGNEPYISIAYTPGYSKKINEPLGTVTAQDHHGIVHPYRIYNPLILKAEHSNQKNVRGAHQALQTQTTRQSMGLVVPFITQMRSGQNTGRVTDPLNIVTAGGIHSGIVTPDSWKAFMAASYNGSNCTKFITDSMGTQSTKDRHALVVYDTPRIEDCYYRMLKPPEVKLAMAFDHDYIILGSGKDQVRQLGNAVTPPAMEWLVDQVIKSMA